MYIYNHIYVYMMNGNEMWKKVTIGVMKEFFSSLIKRLFFPSTSLEEGLKIENFQLGQTKV